MLGAVLVGRAIPSVDHQHTADRLAAARRTVSLALGDLCRLSRSGAETLAVRSGDAGSSTPADAVQLLVDRHLADVAVLENPRGDVVASAGQPVGASVADLPTGEGCATMSGTGKAPAAVVSSVALRHRDGSPAGRAWAGFRIDADLLARLARSTTTDVTLIEGGRVAASSLGGEQARQVAEAISSAQGGTQRVGDAVVLAQRPTASEPLGFVVSGEQPDRSGIYAIIAAVVCAALLLAVVIAFRLARAVTSPLAEVGAAAGRVAGGDLDTRIPVRRRDEVGQLAESFNTMTAELRAYVGALRASRDQLRRNLDLLGDTLSSTHDLDRILTVILETAAAASGAQAGAVFLNGPAGLHCTVVRGYDAAGVQRLRELRVWLGEGIVGTVAETGEPVSGRRGDQGPQPVAAEPYRSAYIAVPFKSSGKLLGVLVLSDRLGSDEFDDGDLATIRTFAGQAAVAVDNVLLHEEAQRLSLTDGLTGLWNYRYFQMNFAKEIERAARFGRPLALLMLDLDRFKHVNDTHGHPRGDAVLAELARRLSGVIREVDTLARYGGEEMVLVLPETDEAGAQKAADRICDVVRRRPIGAGELDEIPVTVSIGVAVFPRHGTTVASLVDRADDALYAAKSAGRDTWRMAAPSDSLTV